jgi:protein-disulfide isomerase
VAELGGRGSWAVSRRVEQKHAARVVRGQLVKQRRRRRALWISFGTIVVLATAGLISWNVYRAQRPVTYAMPAGVTSDGGPSAGITAADEGGAIPVEVYLDFLCPECNQFEANTTATMNQLLAAKKIKLIWHPLSILNTQSNPPGYSMRAASAAGCAADVGMNKMKAFGEALFQAQPPAGSAGLNDDQLIELAGRVGIITPAFAACVRELRYRDWVNNGNEKATQRGVKQAPTVYVNGKPVPQPGPATLYSAVSSGG